jgi:hypothetical protein
MLTLNTDEKNIILDIIRDVLNPIIARLKNDTSARHYLKQLCFQWAREHNINITDLEFEGEGNTINFKSFHAEYIVSC